MLSFSWKESGGKDLIQNIFKAAILFILFYRFFLPKQQDVPTFFQFGEKFEWNLNKSILKGLVRFTGLRVFRSFRKPVIANGMRIPLFDRVGKRKRQ